MKYKVGDRVRVVSYFKNPKTGYLPTYRTKIGSLGTIIDIKSGIATWPYYVDIDGSDEREDFAEQDLELLEKNKTLMSSLIEKIKIAAKSEPDKSAIKAGIRTTSDDFTQDGREAFIEYLYQKNKADFDTVVVQPILTEAKDK